MLTLVPLAWFASVAIGAGQDSPGASWKHQQLKFNYTGFTAHYTCDGLEEKVKQVLRHFGAREGLKVRATGCSNPNAPSPFAWVEADFDALVPDSAGGVAAGPEWRTGEAPCASSAVAQRMKGAAGQSCAP
jgi:hypothetical protein